MQVQMQNMEASLSNELLEGEELIWSGRPEARGKSMVSPGRPMTIVGGIYAALGLFIMLMGFLLMIIISSPFGDIGPFIGMVVFGGFFFFIGLLLLVIGRTVGFVPKAVFYGITDRRVIILRGGRYLRVASYDIQAIQQVQRFERPDGTGDLVFSGTSSVLAYGANTYNNMRQQVFNAIPNVHVAEQKLLGAIGRRV